MARLRRKPARLAVRILCLNYFAQKRSESEEEKDGGEREDGCRCSRPTSDFAGRLTAAKVLPVKERAVIFFDELVVDV